MAGAAASSPSTIEPSDAHQPTAASKASQRAKARRPQSLHVVQPAANAARATASNGGTTVSAKDAVQSGQASSLGNVAASATLAPSAHPGEAARAAKGAALLTGLSLDSAHVAVDGAVAAQIVSAAQQRVPLASALSAAAQLRQQQGARLLL
jgi:hypothetical protein